MWVFEILNPFARSSKFSGNCKHRNRLCSKCVIGDPKRKIFKTSIAVPGGFLLQCEIIYDLLYIYSNTRIFNGGGGVAHGGWIFFCNLLIYRKEEYDEEERNFPLCSVLSHTTVTHGP